MDASGDDDPPLESLSSLYDELSKSGITDGNVAVIDQGSSWCLSAHRDGRVVFEHLQKGEERHMTPVEKDRVLHLWRQLIDGNVDGIMSQPWMPGYVARHTSMRKEPNQPPEPTR
jgi:hypothetical protein